MKLLSLRLLAPLVLGSLASAQGVTFCFGSGTSGPCPCGNTGQTGRGCENSATTGGGELAFRGTPSPDTMMLSASHMLPGALTIFVQGSTLLTVGVPFGDGLRCTGGALRRLYVKSASTNGGVDAPQALDGDLSLTQRSAALGDVIATGTSRYYQAYYHDVSGTFCTQPQGGLFNATNGVKITWQ